MNVGSATSTYTPTTVRTPEAAEVKGARDNDGDSDDSSIKTSPSPLSSTVNMSGQKIGQVINVQA